MERKVSKKYILFLVFYYFFIFRDAIEQVIPVVGFVDELVALCAVPLFLMKLKEKHWKLAIDRSGTWLWILIFFLLGMAGSLIYKYQDFVEIALPDSFLCIKFWLAIYVGGVVFREFDIKKHARKIYFHLRLTILLYTVLIILDNALEIFDASIRYGMRSTQLFYAHPTAFVACCVFIASILAAIQNRIKGSGKWMVWVLVLMCTTLRSKAFSAALAFLLILYLVYVKKKKFDVKTLLMLIPIIILVAWEQIEYYFFSDIQSNSARYQLLVKSLEIANDHFPLGAGFGTFASHFSSVSYSLLYSMYGISDVHGLQKEAMWFVSDAFWPMIIAQSGWVGCVIFVIALWMLFKQIQRIQKCSQSHYVSGLFIFVYLLIASAAESAFVHPLAMPLAIWLGCMLKNKGENECAIPEQTKSIA